MSYTYAPIYRAMEIVSIGLYTVLMTLLGRVLLLGFERFPLDAWWVATAGFLTAYVAADFVSGLVHFTADNFGSPRTPIVGPHLIGPFREHHVDPRGITRHDFIETNGNNCLVCVPALLLTLLVPTEAHVGLLFLATFSFFFMLSILLTNQFHKWAHLEHPPAWIAALQRCRLILGPEHHQVHHTYPFKTYYCITTGWLNPLLHHLRFFHTTEAIGRRLTGSPDPVAELPAPAGAAAATVEPR